MTGICLTGDDVDQETGVNPCMLVLADEDLLLPCPASFPPKKVQDLKNSNNNHGGNATETEDDDEEDDDDEIEEPIGKSAATSCGQIIPRWVTSKF